MDSFVGIQEDVKNKLERSMVNFKKCPKDRLTGVVGSKVGEGSGAANQGSETKVVSCLATGGNKTILLTTALVKAESKNGTYHTVRALLDQGSQGSFITESLVQYLGLKKRSSKNKVLGVGDKGTTSTAVVEIKLQSRINPSFQIRVNAYVLKSVTSLLPSAKVARVEWVDLNEFELADPEYFTPNKIDVLLGAEVYSQVIQQGVKKNINGTLLAQETTLGWILSGAFDVDQDINSHSKITVMHTSVQDDELLRKFWELKETPGTKRMLTEEETKCEELFTVRHKDGMVRLPLRNTNLVGTGGESKGIAEKRLKGLKAKLAKHNKLGADYANVIQEYLSLNHMVEESERTKK
ncbi:uncharacterized protein LOC111349348 [Spodoptera litura]|uniref:Uncharacterized protein LOC111349348 n=1 Tax=Spodoptera litura TaxID=69820 RepID=A0A9J7DTV6_SPOLT|nr:uncharacterized protein LOC111349348 [Spodoptera litura]